MNSYEYQQNQIKNTTSITIEEHHLSNFSSDVKSLHATNITILENVPDPLTFLREYVALSKPVLIRNAFPQISLGDVIQGNEHLMVNVDVTPDGHGDCIRTVDGKQMFVMPLVREMSLGQLRCGLREQQKQQQDHQEQKQEDKTMVDENGLAVFHTTPVAPPRPTLSQEILYYSRQNDCLRTELQPLMKLFPSTIPFAQEAFNTQPEAVNIWIGNEKSVSSIHKDHYENIMCVTCGEKEFTICPPLDAMFFKESCFPTGTFSRDTINNGQWTVEVDSTTTTRWIESFHVNKLMSTTPCEKERNEYLNQYPLLKYIHPMKVSIKAGDMFYLPSLWYHQVTQTCETVAVNYWYDMRFDSPHWCIFHLLQEVRHET
mmetsp:Transcript_1861/g.3360  ORF Transcript_1861/g.3360 Transcript_1861/m.3360 type:complete len:373 (-) Transcript_1861:71-1189(-)